jgi:hypothetical protein
MVFAFDLVADELAYPGQHETLRLTVRIWLCGKIAKMASMLPDISSIPSANGRDSLK